MFCQVFNSLKKKKKKGVNFVVGYAELSASQIYVNAFRRWRGGKVRKGTGSHAGQTIKAEPVGLDLVCDWLL